MLRMPSSCTVVAAMRSDEVNAAASLHQGAFPRFFLSNLGCPFLVEFYRGFLSDRAGVSVVARTPNGRVVGVAVGTVAPDAFFRRLLARRWPWFAVAGLRGAAAHPSRIPRLVRAVRYRGRVPFPVSGALLSSICVDPVERHSGLGRRLLTEWSRGAAALGAWAAYLTTDANDNDAVNEFYRQVGWSLAGRYLTPEGRAMNCYCVVLDGGQC